MAQKLLAQYRDGWNHCLKFTREELAGRAGDVYKVEESVVVSSKERYGMSKVNESKKGNVRT